MAHERSTPTDSREPPESLSAPASPGERSELIDIVRGFALFGVLLSNVLWTTQHFPFSEEQPLELSTAPIDNVVDGLAALLVSYKFYTIFSMLFGLGFALQLIRASEQGRTIVPTYVRRLVVLFLFGVTHACFVWFGDILYLYAQLGLVLLLFRGKSDRVVLGWAGGIAGLVLLLPIVHWLMSLNSVEGTDEAWKAIQAQRHAAMTEGRYGQIVAMNWGMQVQAYTEWSLEPDGTIHWYLNVMWKFLVGFFVGRRLILQDSTKHLALFRRLLPGALAIGLGANAILALGFMVFDTWIPSETSAVLLAWIPVEVGIASLSLAYVCGLALLYHHARWRAFVRPLAPVGRMALTNYLTHSVLFVVIFYDIGFGLIGKVGSALAVLIALAIFGSQMLLSAWWLRRFRFGPMEWLWRSLTYGHRQPMRVGVDPR